MMEYVMGGTLRIHEETGGSVFPDYINFTFNTVSESFASTYFKSDGHSVRLRR